MSIIDAWLQHPTPRHTAHPIFHSLHRWNKTPLEPLQDPAFPLYNAKTTLASMDAGEVRLGLLSAWYGPEGVLISNNEVQALCEAHPQRFLGLCSGDIRDPAALCAEVRSRLTAPSSRFRGVRIIPWLWGLPPTDRLFYPLFATCCELDVPLCLQVGQTGPLRPSDVGRPIPYLEQVLLDFPKLTVVAGHIGVPWTEEMVFLARKFAGRVYIDTSAYTPKRYPRVLVEFMKEKGVGRRSVMYGSNYPMIQHAKILNELDALQLDEECRRLFLRENAERVFKIAPGAIESGGSRGAKL